MWQTSTNGIVAVSGRRPLDRWIRSLAAPALERHCLQLLALAQALTVVLAGGAAKIIYLDFYLRQPHESLPYLAPAMILAVVLHYSYKQMRLHEIEALMGPTIGFGRIWAGLIVAFMLVLGGLYLLKLAEMYSRGWFLIWLALSAVALVIVRWAFMRGLKALVRAGRFTRHVAVLGTKEYVDAVKSEYEKAYPHAVVSELVLSGRHAGALDGDHLVIRELQTAMQAGAFEKVIIALPAIDKARIRVALRRLASYAPEILLCTDLQALPIPVHGAKAIGTLRADVASPVPAAEQDRIEKRVFDVIFASVALILLSPVMVLVALAIKLDSRGPVFFRQRRYGRNNRVFRIFKFRTMTVTEDGDRVIQAERNDPRVTRVGRILRSTSLDEIPQIINVLFGQMSIVGPRPHALAHEETFEEKFDLFSRRRRVLPGITGWAQVNGYRGETRTPEDVEKRMNYDLHYIDNWSIWFDMEIIVRTLLTVTRGAY
jgi:putative colanic acid biosynthesis UDP-glucose lipid carrier transferase